MRNLCHLFLLSNNISHAFNRIPNLPSTCEFVTPQLKLLLVRGQWSRPNKNNFNSSKNYRVSWLYLTLSHNSSSEFQFLRITSSQHTTKATADDYESDGDSVDEEEIRPLTQAELKKKIIKGVSLEF